MASRTVYDAILAALTPIVTPNPLVEWDSVQDQLENYEGAMFLALEEVESDERVTSVGTPAANWIEEMGTMEVHIFSPAKDGYDPIRTMADTVRDGMRFRVLQPSTVRLMEAMPPDPGLIADGMWSSMIVELNYRYHYQKPTYAA